MRSLGAEADHVALAERMALVLDQELDLTMQDVGELLADMADLVAVVSAPRLEREQVRLDRMAVPAPEQLVEDAGAALHARDGGGAIADDLDALGTRRGGGLPEQLSDVKAEMVGDQLQSLERDAALPVLERRQRGRGDPDLPRLRAEGLAGMGAKPTEPLA